MMHASFVPLALVTIVALSAIATPMERLLVAPLDTAAVSIAKAVPTAVLQGEIDAPRAVSPSALVAREFHPRFGAAMAMAARGITILDFSKPGMPARPDDSVHLVLRIHALALSQTTRTVARRTIPPEPPGFDPATGHMTPGTRRARTEGPGLMTTLTATASWVIWDNAGDSAYMHGTSEGASSFRGEASRLDWDEAARKLAKALLSQTPFSPF